MNGPGENNGPDLVDTMQADAEKKQAEVDLREVVSDEPDSDGIGTDGDETSFRAFVYALLLAAVVVVLDQLSKNYASQHLEMYRPVVIFDWLNMTLAHNRGAAFSFLSDAGGWQRWFFSILAAVISVVLVVWLYRLPKREVLNYWALALVLGGAIGNLVDRLRLGYVVDFIDAHWQGAHWPAFNLADSAISMGVVLLIVAMFLYPQKKS